MSDMLYALHFKVAPGSETARTLHVQQHLPYMADAEISCDMRPVRESGLDAALEGFKNNPDIDTLTLTRLRNYRPWNRDEKTPKGDD